jgi:hypothetical protein
MRPRLAQHHAALGGPIQTLLSPAATVSGWRDGQVVRSSYQVYVRHGAVVLPWISWQYLRHVYLRRLDETHLDP